MEKNPQHLCTPSPSRGKSPAALSVWCKSLGCPKNRVDTEKLLGSLGMPITEAEDIRQARLVFVNTCGFITPAVKESIDSILEIIRDLEDVKHRPLLAVGGCMVGRYGAEELARELPEVDLWLPTADMLRWPDRIREKLGIKEGEVPGRVLSGPTSYAWLKVSEGCRHHCSFCTIPSIRGPLKSRPMDEIVAEAGDLLASGVKELVLIAQDLTDYAQDTNPGGENLAALLGRLAGLDGLFWLRMFYLYPKGITPELLKTIRDIGKPILPYFDIPLQHSHPEILKSMGRPFAADPERTCDAIREVLPDAALRTTLIVGYPGETDAQFQHLCDFVERMRFTQLGVFTFWPEEGSAAAALDGQLPQEIKDERRDEIMSIQRDISASFMEQQVGKKMDVLVDSVNPEWPGLHDGRVWFQAPEIDGLTYVSGPGVEPGVHVSAEIVDNGDYDLTALTEAGDAR